MAVELADISPGEDYKRPQPALEIVPSVETRLGRYQEMRMRAIGTVLDAAHPTSGLLPAAREGRADTNALMHHSWGRDTAETLQNVTLATDDPDTLSRVGIASGNMLDLYGTEPWESRFQQRPQFNGHATYFERPSETPPIHTLHDGTIFPWNASHQPDTWGYAHLMAGKAMKRGLVEPTGKRLKTLKDMGNYLDAVQPERAWVSSMWEDVPVFSPLSTAMIVRAGLSETLPFFQDDPEYNERINMRIASIDGFVSSEFPRDKTVPGHFSVSGVDMATVIAMASYGAALPDGALDAYFERADQELGGEQHHGPIRYRGDRYWGAREKADDPVGGETRWPLGHSYAAIVLLQEANRYYGNGETATADGYARRGLARLDRVLKDAEGVDANGVPHFFPESFYIPRDVYYSGKYNESELEQLRQPNASDLLWTMSATARACWEAEKLLTPVA